jgi:hypothetical protein
MPRPCHALTMPLFSRPRHSTAVERRPVGYLPAFGFFRLPRGVPRRFLSETYHSSSQRSIPTTAKCGISTPQKRRYVKLLDKQFEYFRLPRGLTRRTRRCWSRAGERHVMCELTHGMGAAWARHAMCESALSMNLNTAVCGRSVHFLWEPRILSFLPQVRQPLGISRRTVFY